MKTIEFNSLPSYLQEGAIFLANKNKNGIHDYNAENVSDDFVFSYDEEADELLFATYRRFDDGAIAF